MKTTPLHRHNFFSPIFFFFFAKKGAYVTEIEMNKSHHIKEEKNCEEPFRFCCNALFHTDNRGSTSSYVFAEIKVKKKGESEMKKV